MKINFINRSIQKAPLSVLNHLYYYTTQYGLSVRQFTGADWHYWEELPGRLKASKNDERKLNSIIRELEKLAEGSEGRLDKRRSQKDQEWAKKEIVINSQLLSVLAALPADLLALGFNDVIGDEVLPGEIDIVDLKIEGIKGEDRDFVEPDLLLLGSNHLLMEDIKTRGGEKSSRNYTPRQLLNYMRLVIECKRIDDGNLPKEVSHLILLPSADPKYIDHCSEWIHDLGCQKRKLLELDPHACIKLGRKTSSFDYNQLNTLLDQVPIYCRSWGNLADSFRFALTRFNDQRNQAHWRKVVAEIRMLADKAETFK